jgi:hypothetical protein
LGARIGNCREAGFGEETYVRPVLKEGEESFYFGRGGVLVKLMEFQLADMPFEPCGGKEAACSAHFLHHEAAESGQKAEDRSREYIGRIAFPKRSRYEIEFTVSHSWKLFL